MWLRIRNFHLYPEVLGPNHQLQVIKFTWAIVTVEPIYTLTFSNLTAWTMVVTRKEIVTSSYEKIKMLNLNTYPPIFRVYLCNRLRKRKRHIGKSHHCCRLHCHCKKYQDHKILWLEEISVLLFKSFNINQILTPTRFDRVKARIESLL